MTESDDTSRPASTRKRYTIYRTTTMTSGSTWSEALADSNDRPSAIAWADSFEIDDNAVMSVLDNTSHRRIWSTTGGCAVCGTAITVDLTTICLRSPTGAFSGFACSHPAPSATGRSRTVRAGADDRPGRDPLLPLLSRCRSPTAAASLVQLHVNGASCLRPRWFNVIGRRRRAASAQPH